MKNETKLKKLKLFLDENGIKYTEPFYRGMHGHSDLFLPQFLIFIKLQGEDDDDFYRTHHLGVHPVFIRNEDTPKFVIQKVQNTIIRIMQMQQEKWLKDAGKKK